jgi:hypothetical protein
MSATLKKCACGICFISDTEDKSVVCHICKEERKNAIQSSARKIPNWNYLGNEPMTKREQIAALMMQALVEKDTFTDRSALAVSLADSLIAELKRRKDPQQ